MYNRQKFIDTFTPCVISVLLISVVVAIIADFQTHFGFEHIAYAEFVTHPMMFFRHLLEALFASLIVPFFFMFVYLIASKESTERNVRRILISTSIFLILFHLLVLYRFAFIPETPY